METRSHKTPTIGKCSLSCLAWRLENDPLPDPPPGYYCNCDRTEAIRWLEWYLSDGARPAKAAIGEGKRMGFSERTLNRAKGELGVVSKREGLGHWMWELPSK